MPVGGNLRKQQDSRRFIKLLDFNYHKKQPGFEEVRELLEVSTGSLTVRMVTAGGFEKTVCRYTVFPNDIIVKPATILLTWREIREMVAAFEDTENIADEEWDFFKVIWRDQIPKLGRMTESFAGIELFLSGRGNFTVSTM